MMAERDKEEMEADIAKMEFDLKGTAVICRSGSPLILADLKKVNNVIYRLTLGHNFFLSLICHFGLLPVIG